LCRALGYLGRITQLATPIGRIEAGVGQVRVARASVFCGTGIARFNIDAHAATVYISGRTITAARRRGKR